MVRAAAPAARAAEGGPVVDRVRQDDGLWWQARWATRATAAVAATASEAAFATRVRSLARVRIIATTLERRMPDVIAQAVGDPFDPDEAIDGNGMICAPGFIDIQLNGAFGIDFSSPDITMAQVKTVARGLLSHGADPNAVDSSVLGASTGAMAVLECADRTGVFFDLPIIFLFSMDSSCYSYRVLLLKRP